MKDVNEMTQEEYTNFIAMYDGDVDDEEELCPHCHGDGWGLVGVDWDCEDGINGPYDGESERCPWCNGSGKAKDVSIW